MHPQVKVGNHWAGHGNSASAAQKLVNGPGKGSEATAVGPEKSPSYISGRLRVCVQDQIAQCVAHGLFS